MCALLRPSIFSISSFVGSIYCLCKCMINAFLNPPPPLPFFFSPLEPIVYDRLGNEYINSHVTHGSLDLHTLAYFENNQTHLVERMKHCPSHIHFILVIDLSFYLPTYLSVSLSAYLSVCLSIRILVLYLFNTLISSFNC